MVESGRGCFADAIHNNDIPFNSYIVLIKKGGSIKANYAPWVLRINRYGYYNTKTLDVK